MSKHCDCEKILSSDDASDSHDEPLTNSAKAHVPDDLFFLNHLSADLKWSFLPVKKPTAFNKFIITDSFAGKLFQPPRI